MHGTGADVTSSAAIMSNIFGYYSRKCFSVGFRVIQFGCAFHLVNEYVAGLVVVNYINFS